MKHFSKIIFLLLFFHLVLLVKTQFTAWPEMIFWPYLILKGWLPYKDIAIAHSPLLVVELSAFYKFFGVGIWQQKLFSWLIPLLTDISFVYVTKKIFDKKTAVIGLFFLVLFQVYFDGNGIWFDHSLVIFSIFIFYFLHQKNYFVVGALWAVAFFTKQTAFWFILPIGFEISTSKSKLLLISNLIFGALPIVMLFAISILVLGIQKDYLYWSINFGIFKLPSNIYQIKWPSIPQVLKSAIPFIALIPLIISSFKKYYSIMLWSIAGMMGTFPRYEHFHFQPALPFLALATSTLIIGMVGKKFNRNWICIPIMSVVICGRAIYYKIDKADRFADARDRNIVENVRKITSPSQLIFVTNYWDNLYALTETLPVNRPFIPQLSQYVTQDSIGTGVERDLQTAKPKVVVRGKIDQNSPKLSGFENINNFIDNNYRVKQTVGDIDILIRKYE